MGRARYGCEGGEIGGAEVRHNPSALAAKQGYPHKAMPASVLQNVLHFVPGLAGGISPFCTHNTGAGQ